MEFDFKIVKLSELGKIVTGKTPSTKDSENFGGDTLFLTPSDNMESRYSYETSRTLSSIGLNKVLRKILPKDSVCVSCIGSQLGKVVITTQTTVTNQQINSIIPNQDYDNLFIYYSMVMLGKKLNFLSKTSTAVPIINKTEFSNMEIKVPNLIIQRKIAKVLSTLDSFIETNERIIKNLDSQAQAIFKSWFVDFEPFQEGNFIESELGLIPEGWEVKEIKEISDRKNGYTYKSSDLSDYSSVNMVTIKNFNRHGGQNDDAKKPIKNTERVKKHHILKDKDILVACTDLTQAADIIGRVILYSDNNYFDYEIYSMDVVKLVPHDITDTYFIYHYLNSNIFKGYAEGVATGTTVLHLPKKSIDSFKLIYPSKEYIEKFNEIIKPFIELENLLRNENYSLAQTRDTLLPKLMSGEIDVSNIKIDYEDIYYE